MSRRRVAFLVLKVVIALALIAWIFRDTDTARVWDHIRGARVAPILAGVALCFFTILIAGWRWRRLLAAADIEIALKPLVLIAQIGQFFMVFLPGPAGDDLTRMIYIARLAKGNAARACAVVAVDRLIGLASVLFLAAVCVPWHWRALQESLETRLLALAVLAAGVLVLLGGALFVVADPARARRLFAPLARLLPRSAPAGRMAAFADRLFARKQALAGVFAAALCTQLLLCAIYFLAGSSVDVSLPLFTWMGFVPIVIASNAVPITVAGIGVRESLVIHFLAVLSGVDRESAIAVSFVAFAIMLAMSLLGGIVYVFYRAQASKTPCGPA